MAEIGMNVGAWNKSCPVPLPPPGGGSAGAPLSTKPVPMKLFSTWEVDKSTPSCIPRLCSLTLTRLVVQKHLEPDLQSLLIAIRMQSSKRVLRSNEILLQPSGLLDTELELSFSLQYPHFLKRDGNRLEVMLQRRKKYKNRTILGYKTLAAGHLNMSQVLQLPLDQDLALYTDPKELAHPVARVTMLALSSQPVDHDDRRQPPAPDLADRSPGELSEEEDREYPEYLSKRGGEYPNYSSKRSGEYPAYSSKRDGAYPGYSSKRGGGGGGGEYGEDSSNEETSEAEPLPGDDDRPTPRSRKLRDANPTFASRQRNLKQKFVSLLRRFKVNEEEVLGSVHELGDREASSRFVDDLLEDVENLSDSDPDIDTISVHSTPKPQLRPFFTARQSSAQDSKGPFSESLKPASQHHAESERLSDESATPRRIESDSNPEDEASGALRQRSLRQYSSIKLQHQKSSPDVPPPLSPPLLGTESAVATPRVKHRHRKSSLPVLSLGRHLFFPETRGGGGSGTRSRDGKSESLRERKRSENSSRTAGRSGSLVHGSLVEANQVGSQASQSRSSKRDNRRARAASEAQVAEAVVQPRRIILDQMAAILSSDTALPECIVLVNSLEWQGQLLAQSLQNAKQRAVCTSSAAEVRAVVAAVVNKIHKYCSKNTPAQSQSLPMKLAIVGGDAYISSVLRPYVELFSSKSPDWLTYIRFLIVPFGVSVIAKNLALLDPKYGSLFNDSLWRDTVIDKSDSTPRFDMSEISSRVVRYLSAASCLLQLPLAEAIITNRNKGVDDTSQMILPFIGEVRIGPIDTGNLTVPNSTDLDDSSFSQLVSVSGSPPQSSGLSVDSRPGHVTGGSGGEKVREGGSPANQAQTSIPASHLSTVASLDLSTPAQQAPSSGASSGGEVIDLQVDYWMTPRVDPADRGGGGSSGASGGATKKELKCSLKTMIRSMQVYRPSAQAGGQGGAGGGGATPHEASGPAPAPAPSGLSMVVVTQEKKQKIMRLGKKSKDADTKKSQQIDSISRLICTSKSQSQPLSVTVDGSDYSGVKFFQVSSHWQTHVKHFPVLLFSAPDPLQA